MTRGALGLALILFLAAGRPAGAGGQDLLVRLVETGTGAASSPQGLEDVLDVLQKTLGPGGYRLAASAPVRLPAAGEPVPLGEYQVACTGASKSLAIRVTHLKREMMRTSVRLEGGKPVLVAGFPGRSGRMVLVFLLRSP